MCTLLSYDVLYCQHSVCRNERSWEKGSDRSSCGRQCYCQRMNWSDFFIESTAGNPLEGVSERDESGT